MRVGVGRAGDSPLDLRDARSHCEEPGRPRRHLGLGGADCWAAVEGHNVHNHHRDYAGVMYSKVLLLIWIMVMVMEMILESLLLPLPLRNPNSYNMKYNHTYKYKYKHKHKYKYKYECTFEYQYKYKS